MKVWPQKRWKKVLVAIFLVLVVLGAAGVGLIQYAKASINKEVVTPIEVFNADGDKTALVVYQVGMTSGPKDAAYAFADGLASAGWRVELTTASQEAPSELSGYGILVLAYPIYGGKPGLCATEYITRLGNLHQIDVVVINLRWSNAVEGHMKQQIEAKNGTVIESLLAGATDLRVDACHITP